MKLPTDPLGDQKIPFDNNEVTKFEPFADKWFDKDGPLKTLHDINPIRLRYIQQKMDLLNINVADIGCGAGILSESMYIHGATVHAIDLNEKLIEAGKAHALSNKLDIHYEVCSSETFAAQRPNEFDLVVCSELIEHVQDIQGLLNDCSTLLKDDGVLVISTINRTLSALIFGIIAAEKILKIIPDGTHDHDKFVKPNELANLARSAGLNCLDVTGFSYNPFSRHARFSDSLRINYFATFSKFR